MEKDKKPGGPFGAPMDTPVRSTDMDELYRRLQPASRRGKAPVEPVAAAVEAVQHLSTEMDVEDAVSDIAKDQSADSATVICSTCSYRNLSLIHI